MKCVRRRKREQCSTSDPFSNALVSNPKSISLPNQCYTKVDPARSHPNPFMIHDTKRNRQPSTHSPPLRDVRPPAVRVLWFLDSDSFPCRKRLDESTRWSLPLRLLVVINIDIIDLPSALPLFPRVFHMRNKFLQLPIRDDLLITSWDSGCWFWVCLLEDRLWCHSHRLETKTERFKGLRNVEMNLHPSLVEFAEAWDFNWVAFSSSLVSDFTQAGLDCQLQFLDRMVEICS